jgi:acylphosphatase
LSERAVHVLIEGRVQGVGFRAFVEGEAIARGLSGWVRNRRDGSVEAVVSGDADQVALTLAACRTGPRAAEVTEMRVSDYSGTVERGFEELPTA